MGLSITDLFCGAGGSGLGAAAAGYELVMAANHWQRAIDTHSANFPNTEHDCADISQVDPRRYRTTDVLWASPECTNHSQAKGRRRAQRDARPDRNGETLPEDAEERSRATMWDVPRFAEHHAYRAIVVENVVEAAQWVMFPAWLHAMTCLGYEHQLVFLNSMHAPAINAPRAPQSRDRMYIVLWRKGQRAPDVAPRPAAWCPSCTTQVAAEQSWKPRTEAWPTATWGRYRQQYTYRCSACGLTVEPHVLPAAAAIDWTLPGQRIGDRDRPLSAKTTARIEAGLRRYARPLTFEARGHTFVRPGSGYSRAWPVDQPTATLTTTETPALLVPSGGTWNEDAYPADHPFRARTACENEALLVPVKSRDNVHARPLPTMTTVDAAGVAFIAQLKGSQSRPWGVDEPLSTVQARGNHHMLVRHNSSRSGDGAEMCTPITEPARTITTAGHQSLIGWTASPAIEDATFRMLEPSEIQAAMAFAPGYRVLGNRRERVRQLGNGVTPPAAEFLLIAIAATLAGQP